MRIAFVDHFFSWPPRGGADADLYHVAAGIQSLGHEVHLFVATCPQAIDRGGVDSAQLPFPATALEFSRRAFNRHALPARIRRAVDEWKPDIVFLCDGFFLKPYVSEALAHHRVVARYYAYEVACPRDHRLFKDGAPCPMNYLRTPDVCRPCALTALAPALKCHRLLSWEHEYVAARAFKPAYHDRLTRALRCCQAVIVSNSLMKRQLDTFHESVHILPGGVDTAEFTVREPEPRDRAVILMAGRAEDPMKGAQTLREAADILARERSDFEVHVTHPDHRLNTEHYKAIGWQDHAALLKRYAASDICVVPSIWEEPFGLVAVDAMASGRPVCASRVGGLQDIVVDGETGFLFERGDGQALADRLGALLDDPALRQRMGEAGRRRAETEYDWARVMEKHYAPLLEDLLS
ncbi:MAG: glycosyltransferase [Nitrospiraceae bacterium]|nr:glycosyltransferase [Nitrospiraceae bacterium]